MGGGWVKEWDTVKMRSLIQPVLLLFNTFLSSVLKTQHASSAVLQHTTHKYGKHYK